MLMLMCLCIFVYMHVFVNASIFFKYTLECQNVDSRGALPPCPVAAQCEQLLVINLYKPLLHVIL